MTGRARAVFFLFVLILAVTACFTGAWADDAELEEILPGHWTCPAEATEEDPGEAGPVQLEFRKDGTVSVQCWYGEEYAWSCEGTWVFELVTGGMDRLRLQLVWADHPERPGNGYTTECVYNVYAESWTENDTEYTAFILEEPEALQVAVKIADGVKPGELYPEKTEEQTTIVYQQDAQAMLELLYGEF